MQTKLMRIDEDYVPSAGDSKPLGPPIPRGTPVQTIYSKRLGDAGFKTDANGRQIYSPGKAIEDAANGYVPAGIVYTRCGCMSCWIATRRTVGAGLRYALARPVTERERPDHEANLRAQRELPASFVEKGLALAKECTIFGLALEEMTREELIAVAAKGWDAYRRRCEEVAADAAMFSALQAKSRGGTCR